MPKCKECGIKYEQYQFNNKWCKEIDCQTAKGMFLMNKQKEANKKAWNKVKKKSRHITHPKEEKGKLQAEINKLSKLIDLKFGYVDCIDCGKPLDHTDAGHYIAVGANATLRYNLNNIHSQRRGCNRDLARMGSRHTGYYKGLVQRYGNDYAEMVDIGLQNKYKYIGLMNQEIAGKLKIVRSLIRNFDTYDFKSSVLMREMFNKLIGIYN
tara:strand:- start:1328 stop:1957 length:630 start_codon:yes stop_codon:yes gene_type:complete